MNNTIIDAFNKNLVIHDNSNVDYNSNMNDNSNVDYNSNMNDNSNVDYNSNMNDNSNVDYNSNMNDNSNVDYNSNMNDGSNIEYKINKLNKKMKSLNINNRYIYIYTHKICSTEKYEKDMKYVNLTSILISDKNNTIKYDKLNIKKKDILYKNKIKKNKCYIYLIYLKNRINLDKINLYEKGKSNIYWKDIFDLYTLYNTNEKNIINVILKSDYYNKYRVNECINLHDSNNYIMKLNLKTIYRNMSLNFDKLFF